MPLKENLSIKKVNSQDRIFCDEDYAQDLYNRYNRQNNNFVRKDLQAGELVKITGISSIQKNEIYFEVNNSSNIPIDIKKEKRFLEIHGVNEKQFINWISTKEGKKSFVEEEHNILVLQSTPNLKTSLISGFAEKMKDEFKEQLKKPSRAYDAKVVGKNQGGFLVDVYGVQAFLPGGLAAANKIVDFDEYMGKNVKVMIEDYLTDIQTYIVSHKKYLDHVLPSLLKEHDWTKQHEGEVTGSNKYGVFVEFYGQFTGLLHTSKMTNEVKDKFTARQFKPGEKITCWVREVTNDNRLVLTNFEPGSSEDMVKVGEVHKGKITNIQPYGTFVRLKDGTSGLILKDNLKSKEWKVNDFILVEVENIKEDGKIFFLDRGEPLKQQ
jgi:ribosomal protein S1